jgi:cytidyltransferase-like protein
MLHYGHANALRQAAALGDELVVGLIPDSEIVRCKGAPPVLNEAERGEMVGSLKWVDEVMPGVPYDLTPEFLRTLFTKHRIDLVVHGDDPCLLPDGSDAYAHAKAQGRFRVVKRTEGVSSTDLVGRALMGVRDRPGPGAAAARAREAEELARQFSSAGSGASKCAAAPRPSMDAEAGGGGGQPATPTAGAGPGTPLGEPATPPPPQRAPTTAAGGGGGGEGGGGEGGGDEGGGDEGGGDEQAEVNPLERFALGALAVRGAVGDLRVIGPVGTVRADSDGVTSLNCWDGIRGLVWSQTSIDAVHVGDGLADDGSGYYAMAGVMSTGFIRGVYISGPRYTKTPRPDASVGELLKGQTVYGELNGAVIGRSDGPDEPVLDELGQPVLDENGQPVMRHVPGVGEVIGANGAVDTALILGMETDSWLCFKGWRVHNNMFINTAGVGLVSFSGAGAAIDGSEIRGFYVNKVATSGSSEGISHSRISGGGPQWDSKAVGVVQAGGGMYDTRIQGAGSIGTITGVNATDDFNYVLVVASGGVGTIHTRDLVNSGFQVSGTVGTITVTGDMLSCNSTGEEDTIFGGFAGAILNLNVAGDFIGNTLRVATRLGVMTVGGDFDSRLYMYGATKSYLGSLVVNGDIDGLISCQGDVGKIVSVNGTIRAAIQVLDTVGPTHTGLIWALEYTGTLLIQGDLDMFHATTTLDAAEPINIVGNLGTLEVIGGGLRSNLNVAGDAGTIRAKGALLDFITVFGNLDRLELGGGLGGQLDTDEDGVLEDVGWLDIYGSIGTMMFDTTSDLIADVTLGGGIDRIAMRDANIRGTLVSRYGRFGSIEVANGSIYGDITAQSIGTIRVRNGRIGTTGQPAGIQALRGGLDAIDVTGGDVNAHVTTPGRLDMLRLKGGSLAAASTVDAEGGIRLIDIRNGDLDGSVRSGRDVQQVLLRGNQDGLLSAGSSIERYDAKGSLTGSVRAAGGINRFNAGSMHGALVSSGRYINSAKVAGDIVDSLLLAGYDVGLDGAVGGGDDHALSGAIHSGDIGSLVINGRVERSIVAAGIDPGDTALGVRQGFLSRADNLEADGSSNIRKVTLRGGFLGDAADSGFLADTSIDPRFAAAALAAGATVSSGVDPAKDPDTSGSTPFGPGTAVGSKLVVGDLTLTLSGPGRAYFNDATGAVALIGTTPASKLTVRNSGAERVILIGSSDDAELGTLTTAGAVQLGHATIDGPVGKFNVVAAGSGAQWNLPGGIRSGVIGEPGDAVIRAGQIGSLRMRGDFDGNLTADSIASLTADGDVSGQLTTTMGQMRKLNLRGQMSGQIDSFDTIDSLSVAGTMSGQVSVSHGDLVNLRTSGAFNGRVDVSRGMTRNAKIGGQFSGSYRTDQDIRGFSTGSNRFSGLLSTQANIGTFSAGTMTGRAWAGGDIRSLKFASMDDALVAASGDLAKAAIRGNMNESFLLSGLEPGDSGYVADETGNLGLDTWTPPAGDEQTDQSRGGDITYVSIGGYMTASTIAAGLNPGADGYFGTHDDTVSGTGYVRRVKVRRGIVGTVDNSVSRRFGVFAASGMPVVTWYGQPFNVNGNASIGSRQAEACLLTVESVKLTANTCTLTFSTPLDWSGVDLLTTLSVEYSSSMSFMPGSATNISSYLVSPSLSNDGKVVTLRLRTGTWDTLKRTLGEYIRISVDGTPPAEDGDGAVTDTRGRLLDGENLTGDGMQGGDYVYIFGDYADTLTDAIRAELATLAPNAEPTQFTGVFEGTDDVDVIGFTGSQYEYLGFQYDGRFDSPGEQALAVLFVRDTQGTPQSDDDTFEALSRAVYFGGGDDFWGFELPQTGEYYLAITSGTPLGIGEATYTLSVSRTTSDMELETLFGSELVSDAQIAYVSNTIGEHGNLLGGQAAKQLVYVNFTGGTATKYVYGDIEIGAFRGSDLNPLLQYRESQLIYGGEGVTGIMDNVLSIYSDVPASDPDGAFVVEMVDLTDAADWAAYQAADSGLWFTTSDPSVRGLSAETDFTTAFVGNVDQEQFDVYIDILYGEASTVDFANKSAADNATVLAQNLNFSIYEWTLTDTMNAYTRLVANMLAHELGHTLGLQHQPTDCMQESWMLQSDDPDNNPLTANDSNVGVGLMSYQPSIVMYETLHQLGTNLINPEEFPVGQSDQVQQMQWWFA